mmetsp:Transcript_27801/g.70027  ORF Transcript_27801/g.70027 Transcript_27801/m.70027 type:complete len:233 (-) Transcript_27801:252-950(-)
MLRSAFPGAARGVLGGAGPGAAHGHVPVHAADAERREWGEDERDAQLHGTLSVGSPERWPGGGVPRGVARVGGAERPLLRGVPGGAVLGVPAGGGGAVGARAKVRHALDAALHVEPRDHREPRQRGRGAAGAPGDDLQGQGEGHRNVHRAQVWGVDQPDLLLEPPPCCDARDGGRDGQHGALEGPADWLGALCAPQDLPDVVWRQPTPQLPAREQPRRRRRLVVRRPDGQRG